uniref:Uncharacterized protein n=1 Tax=Anguilla anguilla TaxID=7936 RepID=A0A0E9PST5_ANGAN
MMWAKESLHFRDNSASFL